MFRIVQITLFLLLQNSLAQNATPPHSSPFLHLSTFKSLGISDDELFAKALKECQTKSTTLFIPNGEYHLTHTLDLHKINDGSNETNCSLLGESKGRTVLYLNTKDKSLPLIRFQPQEPSWASSVRISNLRLVSKNSGEGKALQFVGSISSIVENLQIDRFDVGIELFNSQRGVYNEINHFRDIRIDDCNYGIKQKRNVNIQPLADESFHGNIYDPVFINVGEKQVGFWNDGYYYNGRFNLFVWTHSQSDGGATILENHGFSEFNVGNISYENYASSKKDCTKAKFLPAIRGSALFQFQGDLFSPNYHDEDECQRTNSYIDYSNGNISWSLDQRLKSRSASLSFPPGESTQSFHLQPYYWQFSSSSPMSGVFRIQIKGEIENGLTLHKAIMIIPKKDPHLKAYIMDEGGYDLNPGSLTCQILPFNGINDGQVHNTEIANRFDVKCNNHSSTTAIIDIFIQKDE